MGNKKVGLCIMIDKIQFKEIVYKSKSDKISSTQPQIPDDKQKELKKTSKKAAH